MYHEPPLETVLRRDRAILIFGIAGISVFAWAYMFYLAWGIKNIAIGMEITIPQIQPWGAVDFTFIFIMWMVMMVAMMVPSAAPMILMYATINR
jgi:predicted metal-binding membrane protein